MEVEHGGGKLFTSWELGSKESKREEVSEVRYTHQMNAPKNLVPPISPQFHIFHSAMNLSMS
jgi:hypothetical protein